MLRIFVIDKTRSDGIGGRSVQPASRSILLKTSHEISFLEYGEYLDLEENGRSYRFLSIVGSRGYNNNIGIVIFLFIVDEIYLIS